MTEDKIVDVAWLIAIVVFLAAAFNLLVWGESNGDNRINGNDNCGGNS